MARMHELRFCTQLFFFSAQGFLLGQHDISSGEFTRLISLLNVTLQFLRELQFVYGQGQIVIVRSNIP